MFFFVFICLVILEQVKLSVNSIQRVPTAKKKTGLQCCGLLLLDHTPTESE